MMQHLGCTPQIRYPCDYQILVGRTLDQVAKLKPGSMVTKGVNQGSNCLGIPYDNRILEEEPLTEMYCIDEIFPDGIKSHAGDSRGQPEVKLLRNAQEQPNVANATLKHDPYRCSSNLLTRLCRIHCRM